MSTEQQRGRPSSPARDLARRLKELRLAGLGKGKLSQAQLGALLAIGEEDPLSAPLISSWENDRRPVMPPQSRLHGYARVFATPRTLTKRRMLDDDELDDAGKAHLTELEDELLGLRDSAMSQGRGTGPQPLRSDFWLFPGNEPVTIVASELPQDERNKLEYAQVASPDFVELYRYADLDAMVELYGHLRAANPQNTAIRFKTASELIRDDSATHLIILGGVDLNEAARDFLGRLELPVRQVSGDDRAQESYFEVSDGGDVRRYSPKVRGGGDETELIDDVALFYRGPNPLDRSRTLTICNAIYGRGTFGAVRALTDARYRDRNERYLRERFGGAEEVGLLFTVPIFARNTTTPDWSDSRTRLFEWSGNAR